VSLRSAVRFVHKMTPAHQMLARPATLDSSPAAGIASHKKRVTTTTTPTGPAVSTSTTTRVTTTSTPATSTTLPRSAGSPGPSVAPASDPPTGATLASLTADADWIASAQPPDGAIANYPFNGTSAAIEPYMSNYGAIGLAEATVATGDTTYANDA
jgi:hypothetical protein